MVEPSEPPLRNATSVAGAAITTIAALLILGFVAVEPFGLHTNPYLDLLFSAALPRCSPSVCCCFRCYDDSHKIKEGLVIKQDCDYCHEVS